MPDTKRINLWSGPRNISTALMYSFAQRSDTTVVDEPLYAHYLTSTDAHEYHPGADEIIADQYNSAEEVISKIIFGSYDTPVAFFKQMTHHLVELDWKFLENTVNVILTRDPKDMLLSYSQKVDQPTMRDVGYAKQLELYNHLTDIGQQPMVLDSKEILMNPQTRLIELCNYLDIPFEKSMLSWEKGARPEDGVWAKHWYHSVHNSTGFKPYQPKTEELPDHLHELWSACEEIFQKLKGRSK
jgi:hypothetical protein